MIRKNALNSIGHATKVLDQIPLTNSELLYEELTKEKQKILRKQARKKVFGQVGGLYERANRFYKKTYKVDPTSSKTKMKFFYEELKNNLWFGLMSKTSKIAPRHVRLTLMYLYIALHLLVSCFFMTFGLNFYLDESDMF